MRSGILRRIAVAGLIGASLAWAGAASAASAPLKITVYGAGNLGSRIIAEAASRGHAVTVVERTPKPSTDPKVASVQGDVTDSAGVGARIAGQDVVISAVRGSGADFYVRTAQSLVQAVRATKGKKPRLLFVGGAGSLETGPGKLVLDDMPPFAQGEVRSQKAGLDYLRTVTDVEWTYFSPAVTLTQGPRTGKYRLGGDQPVKGDDGQARISIADYGVAMIDEAEKAAHIRKRFTAGY